MSIQLSDSKDRDAREGQAAYRPPVCQLIVAVTVSIMGHLPCALGIF